MKKDKEQNIILKREDVPVTQNQWKVISKQMSSLEISLESKIDSLETSLSARMKSLETNVDSKMTKVLAIVEEQRSENKVVMDGLVNLFYRQEETQKRVSALENDFFDVKSAYKLPKNNY